MPDGITQTGGPRWTSLIGVGLHARVAARAKKLRDHAYWKANTAQIQRNQLRSLLEQAKDTAFGREFSFATVLKASDAEIAIEYRKAVPARDYVAFLPYVERMVEGAEPNVLWPGLVSQFCQTSGTTAGDKRIPITDAMMKSNFKASLDIFSHAINWGVSISKLFGGRALFLGGSSALERQDNGMLIGDLSGIATQQIRWPLSAIYSPGRDIALMDHWPTKIDAMAELTSTQDIRMISGMPSWTVALMQRVLEKTGKDRIDQVWPHLTLFTHGGVRYDPFEPTVRRLFTGGERDIPVRLELYPASEGFIAVQDTFKEPGLRLNADHGNYYEFIPLDEIDSPDAPAFCAEEVEPGQRYVVCMSTCAGLWRYIIGDVVVFESVPDRPGWGGSSVNGGGPARLRIVGRHKLFINAFGENLIVENIETAVAHAARETGVEVGEFTASPVYPGNGMSAGLQLAVEVVAGGQLDRFGEAFDAKLQSEVVDYRVKRTDSLGMAPPIVTPLQPGAIHEWMESRGRLGGQNKVPRCANHREFMDALAGAVGATSLAENH